MGIHFEPTSTPSPGEQCALLLSILIDVVEESLDAMFEYMEFVGFAWRSFDNHDVLPHAWCDYYRLGRGEYDLGRAVYDFVAWHLSDAGAGATAPTEAPRSVRKVENRYSPAATLLLIAQLEVDAALKVLLLLISQSRTIDELDSLLDAEILRTSHWRMTGPNDYLVRKAFEALRDFTRFIIAARADVDTERGGDD